MKIRNLFQIFLAVMMTAMFAAPSTALAQETVTINVTISPDGGGTVTGAGTYEKSAHVTLTATPKEGYEFFIWYDTESNVGVSKNNPYTFPAFMHNSLIAKFRITNGGSNEGGTGGGSNEPSQGEGGTGEGTGTGTAPVSGEGTGTGTSPVNPGTGTDTPVNPGGNDTPVNPGTGTDTPAETGEKRTIWVSTYNHGSVTTDKTSAAEGETVTLTVIPDEGYHLALLYLDDGQSIRYSGGTAIFPTQSTTDPSKYTFLAPATQKYSASLNVLATFEKDSDNPSQGEGGTGEGTGTGTSPVSGGGSGDANTFSITVTAEPAEGGTVTGGSSGSYAKDTRLEFKETPNEGYRFKNWTIDGINGGSEDTYPFIVDGDFSAVVAHFERVYKLKTTEQAVCFYIEGSNDPITEAAEGETVVVCADPEQTPNGKYLSGYSATTGVTLTPQPESIDATFIMPAMDVTVDAVYTAQKEYTVDLTTSTSAAVPDMVFFMLQRLGSDSQYLDLNGDGTNDLELTVNQDFTTFYVTKLEGGYSKDTHVALITYPIDNSQYNSVFFKLGNEVGGEAKDIKTLTITLSGTEFTYNGTEQKPTVTVMDGNTPVDVTLEYSNNKNAGEATVTVTAKTTSTSYTGSVTKTFTITPKPVTISGVKAKDKVYDGTTAAEIDAGSATFDGKVEGDELNIVAESAVFSDKNAGEGIAVTFSGFSLTGTNAGNYTLSAQPASVTGTIHRKALELVANAVTIKEGDAVPLTFTGSVKGFVAGENISEGDILLFTLSDPSACTPGSYGITGTLNGSASGNYGQNYTFSNAAANATAFTIISAPALDESKPVVVSEEDGGAAAGTYYALDESVASSLIKTNKTKSQVRLLFSDDTQVKTKSIIVNGKKTHTIKISGKAAKKIKAKAFVKSLPKGATVKIVVNKKVSTARYKKLAKQLRKAGFKGKIKRKTRAAEGDDVDEDEIESGVEYEVLEDCDLFFDIISDEDDDEDIEIEGIMIRKPGDANGDDKVDAADIVEMVNAKEGKPTSENFSLLNADINEDGEGEVDQNDIDVVVDMIME